MEAYKTEGIILKTLKYSETSIICDIYSKDKGLRSYIVSGVRSSRKGASAAIYQPGNIIHLVSYDVDHKKLARIQEINLAHHYKNIHLDIVASSTLVFLIEVTRNAIQEHEINEDLFTFLRDWLIKVDAKDINFALAPHLFLINLSQMLGFGPMNNIGVATPYFDLMEGSFGDIATSSPHLLDAQDSVAFSAIIEIDHDKSIVLTKTTRDRLLDALIRYFQLHLPTFRDIKSLEVLRAVLS
jgi:DNA repair protein RecO (recombination protein O)